MADNKDEGPSNKDKVERPSTISHYIERYHIRTQSISKSEIEAAEAALEEVSKGGSVDLRQQKIEEEKRAIEQARMLKGIASHISRTPITSEVGSVIARTGVQLGDYTMAQRETTYDLREKYRASVGQAEEYRKRSLQIGQTAEHEGRAISPEEIDQMRYWADESSKSVGKAAQFRRAYQAQRRLGADEASAYQAGLSIAEKYDNREGEEARERFREQKITTLKQARAEQTTTVKGIKSATARIGELGSEIQTLKELPTAGVDPGELANREAEIHQKEKERGDLSKQLSDLVKTAGDLNKAFKDLSNGAMTWGQKIQLAGNMVSGLGGAVSSVGQAYQFTQVGIPMKQMEAQIGYAKIVNQQYEDMRAASQMDAAAMMRIMSGAYAGAREQGAELREKTGTGAVTTILGDMGQDIGNTITATAAATQASGNAYVGGAAGVMGLIGTGARAYQNISAFSADLPQMQAELAAQERILDLVTKTQQIPARQLQAAMDRDVRFARITASAGGDAGTPISTPVHPGTGLPLRGQDSPQAGTFRMFPDWSVQTSGYGPRQLPSVHGGRETFHGGVDYNAPWVKAPRGGVLTYEEQMVEGQKILTARLKLDQLKDEKGIARSEVLSFAHIDPRTGKQSKPGRIEAGQLIGYADPTVGPASTGAHIHAAYAVDGKRQDPTEIIRANATLPEGTVGGPSVAMMPQTKRQRAYQAIQANARTLAEDFGYNEEQVSQFLGSTLYSLGGKKGLERSTVKGYETDPEFIAAGKRAKDWQVAGWITDPSKYTQMLQGVTAAGGGTRELEGILREAVKSGVESAKNLEDLGSSISEAAQQISSTYGIRGTAGTAGTMTDVYAQQTQLYGMDTNIATAIARNADEYGRTQTKQSGLNPGSLFFMDRVKRKGISTDDALTLGQLDATTFKTMIANAENDPTKGREEFRRFGLDDAFFDEKGTFKSKLAKEVNRTQVASNRISAGGFFAGGKALEDINKYIENGKQFDSREMNLWEFRTRGTMAGVDWAQSQTAPGVPLTMAPPSIPGSQTGKGGGKSTTPDAAQLQLGQERLTASFRMEEAASFSKIMEQAGVGTKAYVEALEKILKSSDFQRLAESGKAAADTRSTEPGAFSEMRTYNASIEKSAAALTAAAANLGTLVERFGGSAAKVSTQLNVPNSDPNLYTPSRPQGGSVAPNSTSAANPLGNLATGMQVGK